MNMRSTKFITKTAIVAAVYAALTLLIAPLSYGVVQFRLSEVMTLLAFISPQYIVGLTIGCVIANIGSFFFSNFGAADIIFGSAATFISVYLMSKTRNFYIATLWPTLVNGLVIGYMLYAFMGFPLVPSILSVAMGEFVVVSVIGTMVFKFGIMKNERVMAMLRVDERDKL